VRAGLGRTRRCESTEGKPSSDLSAKSGRFLVSQGAFHRQDEARVKITPQLRAFIGLLVRDAALRLAFRLCVTRECLHLFDLFPEASR
jgi:hypothetical protein